MATRTRGKQGHLGDLNRDPNVASSQTHRGYKASKALHSPMTAGNFGLEALILGGGEEQVRHQNPFQVERSPFQHGKVDLSRVYQEAESKYHFPLPGSLRLSWAGCLLADCHSSLEKLHLGQRVAGEQKDGTLADGFLFKTPPCAVSCCAVRIQYSSGSTEYRQYLHGHCPSHTF